MARGEPLLRQWKLLNLLQSRRTGFSLKDLASIAGYGPRTLQRDLKLLKRAGFPVSYEADEYGKRFWRLPPEFLRREGIILSLTESLSLYFARQLLTPLAGTTLAEGLESIIDKIESLLPDSALEHFRDLNELILVRSSGQVDYRKHKKTISILSEAIRESRVVTLTYRSVWRRDRYTTNVYPYGLVYYDGNLYLVGHSERSRAIRMFKLTRVLEAGATAIRFRRPENFTLEEHFRGSFGIIGSDGDEIEVVVEFAADAAVIVEERQWHPSQKIRVASDGKIVASYRLGNLLEFKRWIMGFGPQAVVIRPDSLRREVRQAHAAAAAKYA